MRGTRIALFVDGAEVVSVVDTAITAAGRGGLYFLSNATSATGLHLDNWQVRQ
jgi:hypothetical protein